MDYMSQEIMFQVSDCWDFWGWKNVDPFSLQVNDLKMKMPITMKLSRTRMNLHNNDDEDDNMESSFFKMTGRLEKKLAVTIFGGVKSVPI